MSNQEFQFIEELFRKEKLYCGKIEELNSAKSTFTEKGIYSLINAAFSKKIKNVFVSSFKDGNPYEGIQFQDLFRAYTEKNIFEKLLELPCSLRVTNLQLLHDDLKKLSFKLYQQLGIPVTMNMYITPGAGRNCFLYHPDPQETIVYQVEGKKRWFIPIDKDGEQIVALNASDAQKANDAKTMTFDLQQGDFSYVPYCMLHKAEAFEKELSIHITFAFLTYFKTSFRFFIEDEIKKLLNFDHSFYEKLTDKSLDKWLVQVQSYFVDANKEELAEKIKARINLEELKILKQGRSYEGEFDIGDGF